MTGGTLSDDGHAEPVGGCGDLPCWTSTALGGLDPKPTPLMAVGCWTRVLLRGPAGFPRNARILGSEGLQLLILSQIALSLRATNAEPPPDVALLGSIPRKTLAETLHAFQELPLRHQASLTPNRIFSSAAAERRNPVADEEA